MAKLEKIVIIGTICYSLTKKKNRRKKSSMEENIKGEKKRKTK